MVTANIVLNDEEKRAISDLNRLARRWPDTLWIFSGGGGIAQVLKKDKNGSFAHNANGEIDQSYIVAEVPSNIHIDGGDW